MERYLPPGTEAGFFQRSKADFENTGKNRYTLHILPKSCILRPVIVRACLKIHSRHLYVPLCGIFDPNSVSVASYASFIGAKFPTKWNAQLTESNLKTHPNIEGDGRYV